MNKSAEAFRTIGEVADDLDVPKHVLRFWEGKFPQIKPMKRGGGRRYYRPEDMELLRGIRHLLHAEGYTIKGVQKIFREHGIDQVKTAARAALDAAAAADGGKKRGRKKLKAGAGLDAVAPAPSAVSPGPSLQDVVRAAVRELQACRDLLTAGSAQAATAAAAVAEAPAKRGREARR